MDGLTPSSILDFWNVYKQTASAPTSVNFGCFCPQAIKYECVPPASHQVLKGEGTYVTMAYNLIMGMCHPCFPSSLWGGGGGGGGGGVGMLPRLKILS